MARASLMQPPSQRAIELVRPGMVEGRLLRASIPSWRCRPTHRNPIDALAAVDSVHSHLISILSRLGRSSAAPIEAMTAVLLQINRRYKTRAALRITGVAE